MAWTGELSSLAQRNLADLDPQIARRILAFLRDRVVALDNPRSIGEALKGEFGEFWKYRVGDYRVIASIEDQAVRILIDRIGSGREVYR